MNSTTPFNTTHSAAGQAFSQPLRQFNLFRLVLALAMLVLFYNEAMQGFVGSSEPEAFLVTNILFLVSSLVYIALGYKPLIPVESQIILGNATDILLIILIMHDSGGLVSGLGALLIINIANTGSFLKPREAFLFAAIASIGVLVEQTYSYNNHLSLFSDYSRAGILGIVFFATSLLAITLSRRLKESEAIASQRSADLYSLEKLNELIIQNMRTGILVVDRNGRVQMANNAAESLLGNIKLAHNRALADLVPPLDNRLQQAREQPRMHHRPIQQHQGLPDLQPGFRHLDDGSGNTIIFLEDASQLNQRFQQMKLASLGRLTASIAHEIRNPLSAINHAAQLLNESDLDMADTKLTNIINTQVRRLDSVVENVLQLSRQHQTEPDEIILNEWLKSFVQEFCSSQNMDSGIFQLDFQIPANAILFEASHLYQIINNLCNNAIAHSKLPTSELNITLTTGFDEQLGQIYLDIADNGPGIPPDQIEKIFEPFFTTSSQGTGLGLYISKEMAENNRAKMRYIQKDTAGSCFRLYFLSPQSNDEYKH